MTPKKPLWLLLCDMAQPDVSLVLPSLAWLVQECGALFESYLEAQRDGRLFARTGSTVLGGAHFGAFNYLCATFEVQPLVLGQTELFDSSLAQFGLPVFARAASPAALYRAILVKTEVQPQSIVVAPEKVRVGERELEIGPYLFPDIFWNRALALSDGDEAQDLAHEMDLPLHTLLSPAKDESAIDFLRADDTYASITRRIAARWEHRAQGVAFGDPAAILSQIPAHCREGRIALFGERRDLPPSEVQVAAYVEQTSEAVEDVAQWTQNTGNRVIVGRQTGDGDIFEWSKSGACIQIVDPNRPAFPVIEVAPQKWTAHNDLFAGEPDDETLRQYAREGKILTSLLWHSGEVAHNEAMLNLLELCAVTGLKMGIGTHAQRYETCPQGWELLGIARERGGVCGLVEPVLHSGGLGVLAEANCPPDILRKHCEEALRRIRDIAGEAGTPRGYYAFMDSDLATLTEVKTEIFESVAQSGLEYFVSSAMPGRNRVWHQKKGFLAFNQTPRTIHAASPFVRITTLEDLETAPKLRPGWIIGTLDAPVISFNPYIWRRGTRFMQIVDWMTGSSVINVLPRTIARYARILNEDGFLPREK